VDETKENQKINYRILDKLENYLFNNPEVPFCKALQNLGINRKEELMGLVDTEKESSEETLKRMENEKS